MELNPNHPMTASMRDLWYKVVALLMQKTGQRHVEITEADIQQMADNPSAVAVQTIGDKIVLDLVSMEEAERIAKREGGLPH